MMKNPRIAFINVGLSTKNIGDQIISQACNQFLNDLEIPTLHTSSHLRIPFSKFKKYNYVDHWIVGGSNIIGNRLFRPGQLPISLASAYFFRPKLLMLGCGWIDNRTKVDFYSQIKTRLLYDIFAPHSVRDSETLRMLKNIGYKNVINTGCPTLWYLKSNINEKINKIKSQNCIFTLTDYRKSPEDDAHLIKIIYKNYKKIYFWPQGSSDKDYFISLFKKKFITEEIINSVKIIKSSLQEYDKILQEKNIDYVGTRLHGGIRAIQREKRTLIIGIDNRANNIGKDNNLWVLKRELVKTTLETIINNNFDSNIKIPHQEISKFKYLFQKHLKLKKSK